MSNEATVARPLLRRFNRLYRRGIMPLRFSQVVFALGIGGAMAFAGFMLRDYLVPLVVTELYLAGVALIFMWQVPPLRPDPFYRWQLRGLQGSKLGFRQAFMADDLGLLLDPMIAPDAKLTIVGGDPAELVRAGYSWQKHLRRWAREGAFINYILVEPSDIAKERFKMLCEELGGKFKLCTVKGLDDVKHPEWRTRLQKMKTAHVTLLENATGEPLAMWVERYHPPRSWFAFDCIFYPTEFVREGGGVHDDFQYYRDVLKETEYNYCRSERSCGAPTEDRKPAPSH